MADQVNVGKQLSASGSVTLPIHESTWVALWARQLSRRAWRDQRHTSAIQLLVGDKPLFTVKHASSVLEQIEGAIAYVDTLAPRPDAPVSNRCGQRWKQPTIGCTNGCTNRGLSSACAFCTIMQRGKNIDGYAITRTRYSCCGAEACCAIRSFLRHGLIAELS